jgi:hypothetical protein
MALRIQFAPNRTHRCAFHTPQNPVRTRGGGVVHTAMCIIAEQVKSRGLRLCRDSESIVVHR